MENKKVSQFECLLELARSRCHCTPWDYPVPPPSDSNESGVEEEEEEEDGFVCDYLGYYCFSQVMNNVSHVRNNCRCPPDCETLVGKKGLICNGNY